MSIQKIGYGCVALELLRQDLVYACPLCHTETGSLVRAGIFNENFFTNLMITLLPFIFFLGITAWIYFGNPWRSWEERANLIKEGKTDESFESHA